MAAKAAFAWPADLLQTWNRFQELAESRVQEGNIVAGERLWEITKPSGFAGTLVIRSISRPADFIECLLDLNRRLLTCRPGAEGEILRFQLVERSVAPLLYGEAEYTVDQALSLVLDQLVWRDDFDSQPEFSHESI